MEQTPQEVRQAWQVIRPADYAGTLERCSRCGSAPQLFVIDPVGTWIKHLEAGKKETFFAVRCACGMTGKFCFTGKCATGKHIDEQHAAELAARSWNAENRTA